MSDQPSSTEDLAKALKAQLDAYDRTQDIIKEVKSWKLDEKSANAMTALMMMTHDGKKSTCSICCKTSPYTFKCCGVYHMPE